MNVVGRTATRLAAWCQKAIMLFGSCAEEALIYHLQKRIEELKDTVYNMRLGISRIRQDAGQFLNAYHPEPTEYQACSEVCPFGEGDCIHNPEYIPSPLSKLVG